ncbi:hypothetical protein QOZ80_7BG0584550 [Eleusine coracana subsp. coracana]|nr:hypothetical protein QOZ80_7BG0584550 [Eleusine coracana subsp. coracana]
MDPPRPVPELMDEVVDEILVRCPPDDPARLLRAALVCRRWRRIVSDPGFRRRFIERHRAPPMLGFLCNVPDDDLYLTARFVPTLDFRPRRAVGDRRRAVDARHGRVLLHSVPLDKVSFRFDLVVWDPITDEQRALPRLSLHASPWTWNAAVLCAGVGGGCDHLDCHCAPFLVHFVAVFNDRIVSCVFSSETGDWGKPAFFHCPSNGDLRLEPSVLVGNALHFVILFPASTRILQVELATGDMSVIDLPPTFDKQPHILLMTTEDNGLGFATIHQSKVYLWSKVDGIDGDAIWDLSRVIELETLLPTDALSVSISPHVVGFADGIGDIFLGTEVGYFTINPKTNRVKKVVEDAGFFGIFSFISFYTPELGAASTCEKPQAGASISSED